MRLEIHEPYSGEEIQFPDIEGSSMGDFYVYISSIAQADVIFKIKRNRGGTIDEVQFSILSGAQSKADTSFLSIESGDILSYQVLIDDNFEFPALKYTICCEVF